MNIRAASLLFAFVFAALPAHAQRHDDGDQDQDRRAHAQRHDDEGDDDGHAGLASAVAALAARVDKLEGNITAADLVGTYRLTAIDTPMSAFVAGVPPWA